MTTFNAALFIAMLNDFAEKTATGFMPISKANPELTPNIHDYILYDDKVPDKGDDSIQYKIVCDKCWDCGQYDVIDYYDEESFDYLKGIKVRVVIPDEEEPYIDVWTDDADEIISIENGHWHVV